MQVSTQKKYVEISVVISRLNRIKEKFRKRLTITFVNTISDFIRLGRTSSPIVFGNSSYTFHKMSSETWANWRESRAHCRGTGSDLVSIESTKEWNFLNDTIQKMETTEYFIGLEYTSGAWRWISDNSKVNDTKGEFPWAKGEPSNDDENCAVMYKNYRKNFGLFNDLRCTAERKKMGYICESPVNSNDQEGMSYKLLCFLLRLHWAFPFFK